MSTLLISVLDLGYSFIHTAFKAFNNIFTLSVKAFILAYCLSSMYNFFV